MKLNVAALLVLAMAALPEARANVEDVPQRQVFSFGPFVASLDSVDIPLANQRQDWTLLLVLGPNGGFHGGNENSVTVAATLGNITVMSDARPRAGAHWEFNWMLPAAGDWNVTVHVSAQNMRAQGSTMVHTYPDVGYRIMVDVAPAISGAPSSLIFTGDQHASGNRSTMPERLGVQLERWNEWESEILEVQNLTAIQTVHGTWRLDHTFATAGMYHVSLFAASGEFALGDMPPQRFEVSQGPPLETGLPRPVLVAGALVVVASIWLMLERRQGRK